MAGCRDVAPYYRTRFKSRSKIPFAAPRTLYERDEMNRRLQSSTAVTDSTATDSNPC
jgi:hypothetical protein